MQNARTVLAPGNMPITVGSGSSIPSFSNALTYTRFWFPGLVYCAPGTYAIVINTPSSAFLLWEAELNQPALGSNTNVSATPFVGSEFRSQNGGAWTAYQNYALMFQIICAQFNTGVTSVVEFDNIAPTVNTYMDVFDVATTDFELGVTSTSYTYQATTQGGSQDPSQSPLLPLTNVIPTIRKQMANTSNGQFKVFATMRSSDQLVSPQLNSERLNVIAVQNLINAGGLNANLVQFTSTGTNLANISVTISAPTGPLASQANAYVRLANGSIANINFDIPGAGYIITPNISFSGTNAATISATIGGETSQSGGNALFRYLTNPVVLNPGFSSGDLQVYITANKQVNTDLEVYYKIMSAQDPDQNFNDKYWTLMVQNSNQGVYAANNTQQVEYQYVTSFFAQNPPQTIQYTANGVTYNNFLTFAIKICGFSTSTTIVPVVYNMRGIALAS